MRYVLLSAWRFFAKIFKKKKEDPPVETEMENLSDDPESPLDNLESPAGEISIVWSEDGDFKLFIDIFEVNQTNAEVLALLLYNLNSGEMLTYFLQALQSWCDNNVDKSMYVGSVLEVWKMLENHANKRPESLAVHAADVFNLRGSRGNEHN